MKYTTKQLSEGIYAIEEDMVRSFLFIGEGESLLYDACMSGGQEFEDTVKSLLPKQGSVSRLLLSHADGDHLGGAGSYDSVMMHPSEFGRFKNNAGANAGKKLIPVWEGDDLIVGDRHFKTLHIPGHTPGSIALIDSKSRAAFCGDSIAISSPIFMFGEGRCLEAYIESLKKIQKHESEFDVFYCCHGDALAPKKQLAVLLEAATKLLNGELEGENPPMSMPCKLYRCETAAFLY